MARGENNASMNSVYLETLKISSFPLISHLTHGFGSAINGPRHKRAVKFECRPAGGDHKAAHILRVSVGFGHRRLPVYDFAVPIECLHETSGSSLLNDKNPAM
jgi:hypothetical protein